jgi:hypothetical protein
MDKKPLFSDLSFITKSNNLQDGDFQHYFICIVAGSFIDGGNQSAWIETTDLPEVTD